MEYQQPPQPPERSRGSWSSLFFVLLVAMGFCTFLLFAPLGRIGIAILVGGLVFPTIIAVHYFTWGRLMRRMLEDDDQDST